MRNHRIALFGSFLSLLVASAILAASPPNISGVTISPPFFNPTAGQSVTIAFNAGVRGKAIVTILDRDRFPIRTLPPLEVSPGLATIEWDGRDDKSGIVPDEAWNVRIALENEVYDPSLDFVPRIEDPQPRTYSPVDGILSFRLLHPSRVHIEAGQATWNAKTGRAEGPILKTIVNREPRVAGAVVERWNGFDESGTIRVASLPNFVVSVLATSLPDASIITRGNRREAFLDYARRKRPASALVARKRAVPTHHHTGLDAFEDRSPVLRVKRSLTAAGALRMEVRVEGPSAAHFLQQPGTMSVYVDEKRVATQPSPANPLVLTIPAERLASGERRIAVNWGSDYGPAATTSFLLDVQGSRSSLAARR